jgi:hypothetical protein
LERITDQYAGAHGRLPDERARHALGWWAAQDTRREKKTPKPLKQLLAWWRTSAILRFGKQMVDGLLERCRAAGAAIRERVGTRVDTALAAVDVAAVVSTVRRTFARRHVLAEARRHLLETLRGRAFPPGLDDYIADGALSRHSRQLTGPQPGRRAPTRSRTPPTSLGPTGGGSPGPTANRPGVEPVRAGPGGQPRLQNAVRDAGPSSRYGDSRPPGTPRASPPAEGRGQRRPAAPE